jgi:hypothetical protein
VRDSSSANDLEGEQRRAALVDEVGDGVPVDAVGEELCERGGEPEPA